MTPPAEHEHRPPSGRAARRRTAAGEVLVAFACVGVLLHALRAALFEGRTTFIHDVLFWTYPVYHFLADNLLQGRLPYWNPFSHGGEPLYPLLLQLRMLDPASLIALAVGRLFTTDLTTLFNWGRVACGLVASFGAYLFLRQWTPYWLVRVSLLPVLLWSSFVLTSFRQTGTNDMFIFAPYAAYFLFRILHFQDHRWVNWVGLGIAVGLAWQSYYFVGVWVFLLFTVVGFALFRREAFTRLRAAPGLGRRAAVTAALVALMALPNAVVLLERGAYIFPPRLVDARYETLPPVGGPIQSEPGPSTVEDKSVMMPYALVRYSGSFMRIWDFVLMTVPDANRPARPQSMSTSKFGRPSELFLYLGLLVYGGALLGLVAGRHELKRVWALHLGGFGLLMLGPIGGLHWLLYQVYPPLWFLRHTQLLLNFFVLAALYFYVLGANRLVEWRGERLFGEEGPDAPSRAVRCLTVARFAVLGYVIAMITLVLSTLPLLGNHWPTAAMAVFLLGALAFTLRARLGGVGLFWGVLITQAALVLTVHFEPVAFLARVAAFLALPVLILLAVRRRAPAALRPALAVLVLLLVVDLGQFLYASSVFWSERRPEHIAGVPARPRPPRFINMRVAALNPTVEYGQSLRYLELAAGIPSAFSSIRLTPENHLLPGELPLATVLESPRWNSLLMLRPYFALIHSDLPAPVLEELFAIHRPLLQFRDRASVVAPGAFPEALRRLGDEGALQALRSEVMLNEPLPTGPWTIPVAPPEEPRFRFRLTAYDYNIVDLTVDAAAPGFLYYADGYDRHWTASIDGERAPVLRANGNFKAVPITAGGHMVRLAYDPVVFRWSLYVFAATPLVAVVILVIAAVIRSLRRQPRLPPVSISRFPASCWTAHAGGRAKPSKGNK